MTFCPWRRARNGSVSQMFSEYARKAGAFILGGSFMHAVGGKIYNTAFLFDPSGEIVAEYSKTHLFDTPDYQESKHITPGGTPNRPRDALRNHRHHHLLRHPLPRARPNAGP